MKAIYKNIALAALALGAAACSQEDDFSPSYLSDPDAVRITAQVGTKDVMGGFTRSNPLGDDKAQAEFNIGDQIAVAAGTQAPVTYQLGADGWNPVGNAYLKWQTNEMSVTAYYPVGRNNASATTFTIPTAYTDESPIADADYMTYSGTQSKENDKAINLTMQRKMVRIVVDEISFNDQFAEDYSVTAIKVHANTTGYADGEPVGGTIEVSALQQDGDFYALLAPTTENEDATFLTVTVAHDTNSEDVHTLTVVGIPATTAGNSYNYSLVVGKDYVGIGNVTVADWKTGEIIGGVAEEITPSFSVSANQKVLFSPGNLQYTQSTETWSFAENQWDYLGKANINAEGDALADIIDLFCWSSDNSANNFGVSISEENSDFAGNFVDWGTNQIDDYAPNTWRTLSADEWLYLFHGRENAESLFALSTVNGVPGLIILPDNWVTPSGLTFVATTAADESWSWDEEYSEHWFSDSKFQHNTYTAEEWKQMETAGAVFLPITGGRSGTYMYYYDAEDLYKYGYYWSSTGIDDTYSYYLYFGSEHVRPAHTEFYMSDGLSVRLVKDL